MPIKALDTKKLSQEIAKLVKLTKTTKTLLPITQCVKIHVENGFCEIMSTDLEKFVQASFASELENQEILIKDSLLIENLKLTQDFDKAVTNIKNANLVETEADINDFPEFTRTSKNRAIVDSNFKAFFDIIKNSMSKDATKNVLCGAKIAITVDKIELAATDGYKLDVKRFNNLDNIGSIEKSCITPYINLPQADEYEISFDNKDSYMKIAYNKPMNNFNTFVASVTTRLIDGQYPDYNRILPNNNNNQFALSLEQLKEVEKQIDYIIKTNKVTSNDRVITTNFIYSNDDYFHICYNNSCSYNVLVEPCDTDIQNDLEYLHKVESINKLDIPLNDNRKPKFGENNLISILFNAQLFKTCISSAIKTIGKNSNSKAIFKLGDSHLSPMLVEIANKECEQSKFLLMPVRSS